MSSLRQRCLPSSMRSADRSAHAHRSAAPAATTLADILGYHYYTELAHSAGMPRAQIEEPGLAPKEKVRRLVPWLARWKTRSR